MCSTGSRPRLDPAAHSQRRKVKCVSCEIAAAPEDVTVDRVERFEGPSDPADEAAIYADAPVQLPRHARHRLRPRCPRPRGQRRRALPADTASMTVRSHGPPAAPARRKRRQLGGSGAPAHEDAARGTAPPTNRRQPSRWSRRTELEATQFWRDRHVVLVRVDQAAHAGVERFDIGGAASGDRTEIVESRGTAVDDDLATVDDDCSQRLGPRPARRREPAADLRFGVMVERQIDPGHQRLVGRREHVGRGRAVGAVEPPQVLAPWIEHLGRGVRALDRRLPPRPTGLGRLALHGDELERRRRGSARLAGGHP